MLLQDELFDPHVEMTNDGELIVLAQKTVCRVNKDGRAEKLLGLEQLTLTGVTNPPRALHFDDLLGALRRAAILYVSLSNQNREARLGGASSDCVCYVGKLDVVARRLTLLPIEIGLTGVVVDTDGEKFYYVRADSALTKIDGKIVRLFEATRQSVLCRDFIGTVLGQWPLPRRYYPSLCAGRSGTATCSFS